MKAAQALYWNKNKQELLTEGSMGAHKLAYVQGQEIAKEHERLVHQGELEFKQAPVAKNKMVREAANKSE
jgi:hypothetical protein